MLKASNFRNFVVFITLLLALSGRFCTKVEFLEKLDEFIAKKGIF